VGAVITGQSLLGAGQHVWVSVESDHDLYRAHSLADAAAHAQGFDQTHGERVRLAVTEMASNLSRYAHSGRIFVRLLESGERRGVELVATDQGPGMGHAEAGAHSGEGADVSPTGHLRGGGLREIARVSDLFDLYSAPGRGTVMMSRVWEEGRGDAANGRFRIGTMVDPIPGEVVSGDAWAVEQSDTRVVALVADGLGHGAHAAAASAAAVETFRERHREPVEDVVGHIHRALRGTRGAAIAVTEVNPGSGRIRFCGIGNITARLLVGGMERNLISHFGIVGYQARRIRAFEEAWEQGSVLIVHSDGLSPTWDLSSYSGILRHHPQLAAATVMRDATRAVDDALVLVLQDGDENLPARMSEAR